MRKIARELLKPLIMLHRRTMQLIDKNYIKNKLAKRRGKCKKCGSCCKSCRFLDKKTKLCKTYNRRPVLFCYKEFPLDRLDQKIWDVEGKCGFYFQ